MKKYKGCVIAITLLGLLGCGSEIRSLNEMNIVMDERYAGPYISWQPIESNDAHYEVMIRAVNGRDGGADVQLVSTETTTSASYNGLRQLAWYAQENDYYGWMQYQVTAYEKETAVGQGISEPFLVTDYYPEASQIPFDPETINGLHYWGNGDSTELIFSYSLYQEDHQFLFEAEYWEEGNRIEIDTEVSEDIFEQIKPFLKGTLQKRHVDDPELVILDGSEEQITLNRENQSELEKSWYEFIPEDKEGLVRILKTIGR